MLDLTLLCQPYRLDPYINEVLLLVLVLGLLDHRHTLGYCTTTSSVV